MADPDNNYKTHLKTIKQLHGRKRFEFIWEYYRLQIIITIVLIIIAGLFLNTTVFNRDKYDLTVAFYGDYAQYDERQAIKSDLEEKLHLTIRMISFDTYSINHEYATSQAAAFLGEYVIGGIDVIITNETQMQTLIDMGYTKHYEPYSDNLFIAVASNSKDMDNAVEVIRNILRN